MSKERKQLSSLMDKIAKLMAELNGLEKTFSRLKNEAQELLKKMLSAKNNG